LLEAKHSIESKQKRVKKVKTWRIRSGRGRRKTLAEKRGEERVSAMSDESVSGINKLRNPTVVVGVRVSECCRRTIVRRRLSFAEGTFTELATGSAFVWILVLPFRRHRCSFREREMRTQGKLGF